MYGDYEAQRHWMEITLHTPLNEWYVETERNPLQYWGLDYPPVSAFQSLLYGALIHAVDPGTVALESSRGERGEALQSRFLMRMSVLLSDVAFIFPVALVLHRVLPLTTAGSHGHRRGGSRDAGPGVGRATLALAAVWLLQPGLILIDHGHFQYNGICLGLAALGALAVMSGRQILGSILFCISINHKQMAMYYAPAFFAHLLGWSLQGTSWLGKIGRLSTLGVSVLATFAVIWGPFVASGVWLDVLQRLVPVKRGLFEDYVANFWCATHPVFKWKLFDQQIMVKLCTGATLLALLPSCVHEVLRPSSTGLLRCMATCSLSFFLFSYQVHEKSILLPAVPIALLASHEPETAVFFSMLASASMYPLIDKDNLTLPYMATMVTFIAVCAWPQWAAALSSFKQRRRRVDKALLLVIAQWLSLLGFGILHILRITLPAPVRLPFLHDMLFTSFSFVQVGAVMLYLNVSLLLPRHLKQD
ncbi:unnamed protein product [Pedinophyceae sp. YPF-701]|nr:unnamed protein product [Pedinophyceae sp. YPF-701]